MFEIQKEDALRGWNTALFPDDNDLSGAAQALFRLQHIYDLDAPSLSKGKLNGISAAFQFTADDCFELGRQALHSGYYDFSILWLEMSYQRLLEEGESNSNKITSNEIMEYLTLSTFEKGRNSAFLFTQSLVQFGYRIDSALQDRLHEDDTVQALASNSLYQIVTNPSDDANYQKLCQSRKGLTTMKPLSRNMKCRLVTHHAFFILRPVREEELWLDPKISIFYNVISDHEIEIVKSLALPILERAEVAEYVGSISHRVSETRVTKVAWLKKIDHPVIPDIYQRIEDITGLSSISAEPFQMANYGLGGHFHLHLDVLPNSETYFGEETGNRIATWLTYLSDVDGGGATVFPRLNLTVWPRKGSALFWHNIKSDGRGDMLTLHGACPVVTGSKWVSNVWLHERGQEFRLRCGKEPESPLLLTRNVINS